MDVGAIAFHPEEIGAPIPAALVVFDVAGRGEDDAVIGKIERIGVADPGGAGQLAQAGAIGIDLPDVVILVDLAAHRENDPFGIEADFGIADHPGRRQQGFDGAGGDIQQLQGAGAVAGEVAGIEFIGVGDGFDRMEIAGIIGIADHKDNRLAGEQGIGQQDLAFQRLGPIGKARIGGQGLVQVRRLGLEFGQPFG